MSLKKIKIGLNISKESGLSFFGLEEVNSAIKQGAKITAISEGDAIMKKLHEDDENVRLTLSGFNMVVTVEE